MQSPCPLRRWSWPLGRTPSPSLLHPPTHSSPTVQVELVPGGRDTPVTADNRLAYIHRVADYRLNQQIREPAAAFLRGLHELIQPDWVRGVGKRWGGDRGRREACVKTSWSSHSGWGGNEEAPSA